MTRDRALRAMDTLLAAGFSSQINARVMSPDHRIAGREDEWEAYGNWQVVFDVMVLSSPDKGLGIGATRLRELCDIAESIGLEAQLHMLDGGKIALRLPARVGVGG